MMYMNVVFIFMFAWLPAGLQQLYVRKLIGSA